MKIKANRISCAPFSCEARNQQIYTANQGGVSGSEYGGMGEGGARVLDRRERKVR